MNQTLDVLGTIEKRLADMEAKMESLQMNPTYSKATVNDEVTIHCELQEDQQN